MGTSSDMMFDCRMLPIGIVEVALFGSYYRQCIAGFNGISNIITSPGINDIEGCGANFSPCSFDGERIGMTGFDGHSLLGCYFTIAGCRGNLERTRTPSVCKSNSGGAFPERFIIHRCACKGCTGLIDCSGICGRDEDDTQKHRETEYNGKGTSC